MNESILNSIKKLLGIVPEYTDFDQDITLFINSVFPILRQLGCGPKEGFTITDANTKWSDYIGDNKNLEIVKSFVYLKVRLLFDPPAASAHMEAFKQNISELEWRIKEECEFDFSIDEYEKPTDKEDSDE